MLAVLANKNGGSVSFTQEELKSIPDAAFKVNVDGDKYTLTLEYDEPKEAAVETA